MGSNSSETLGPRHSKAHPTGWACNRVATVCDDGFGGPGIVLRPGKLISVIFAPCLDMPIINRLHDRYDDYVLDVEFKIKTELENGEKPNFTLKLATAQLLARVYSNERRREKLGK